MEVIEKVLDWAIDNEGDTPQVEFIRRIVRHARRGSGAVPDENLERPISLENLMEYTKLKYPEMKISERVHEALLSDLNKDRYRKIKDIDLIVNRTKGAVDAYQRESPDVFKFGTDYITKALGFGDMEFRTKHGFMQKTKDAFVKHGSLVSGE